MGDFNNVMELLLENNSTSFFLWNLKVRMYSSPEIHGFSPGGFQYGVFRISVRIPIFAMARMSPRESSTLAVEVVQLAPILHFTIQPIKIYLCTENVA